MDKILIFITVIFGFIIFKLILRNKELKKMHLTKINQLTHRLQLLLLKQKVLDEKILISADYASKYKSDAKQLNEEILALQKTIFELLVNK